MMLIVAGTVLITFSGIPGLFFDRRSPRGEWSFCILLLTGVAAGLAGTLGALPAGETIDLPWHLPGGALSLGLDPISKLFLLPLFLVTACGALYGLGYWPQREHPRNGRRFRLFYGAIAGALIILLTARNALLFLVAWEVMALCGFFLITTEEEKDEARRAGFVYLAATHTGTLALFAMFALLGQEAGTLQFPPAGSIAASGTAIFLLGLFGFGLKAGLMPLHIWLPGAHAAAPSHASALLSGVMIKTGIYGLVRLTSFFAAIPPWWGWTVLLIGAASGVLGVAFAIAQHDIKRLLAYHSVENIGIIALGFGVALLGRSFDMPTVSLLGMAGALLHVANHGLFKSLLFLSAGSVIHAAGTRDIDRLGGLLRRQPATAFFFLVGAVAISGLPPFNGFISEWLIYLAAFGAMGGQDLTMRLAVLLAPVLALIGGLASACFVKVLGVAFLGEPRSEGAMSAHEAPFSMRLGMAPLMAACAWIGLLPGTVAPLLCRAASAWSPALDLPLRAPLAPLQRVGMFGWGLLLVSALVGIRLWRRSRGAPGEESTWGCGFAFPTPRMQYTASSFGDFLTGLFRFALHTERHGGVVRELLPRARRFHSHTPDVVLDRCLLPLFRGAAWIFVRLRSRVQNGMTSFYLLYVALTLFVLLLTFA